MHAPSIWGLIVIALVVVLLFGRGKIAGLMGEVASGLKAFRHGLKDEPQPQQLEASGAPVEAHETDKLVSRI